MTVHGIRTAASQTTKVKNGVGAFILQCKKMEFHYCDWAGSSRGMNGFIKGILPKFAAANPQIEFSISPRPNKHPVVTGHYINGRTKPVCVRNLSPYEILEKVELLRDASGEKLTKTNKAVTSTKDSVRGIWSPFHGKGEPV
ncbi:thioredoxin-like protein [Emericellopsis atlantica]|uniref:Large ribosomal subunit protein mL43 n=1 Tax=Emericellopsis atlantica TaxID=2614577 RepID=A0A9P8CRQ5_9HYPO|nr:thioredoxin-like protein [Emericellopsis atlantica]KAG9257264.1 thioredoxin-like protein [Emericellopsis atlantica]